jgi:uncharacterized protein (TIGR03086 family)
MHDLQPTARRLGALVTEIDDAQLGAPTPCAEYTVADLLDHIGGLAVAFAEAARKEQGTNASVPPPGSASHLVADWRTRIPADLETLGTAWADPAAWDGMTTIAGAEMPASSVGTVALEEILTHAWDLARALGQPFDADTDAIAGAMEFIGPVSEPDAPRPPIFGPVVAVPDDASAMDRFVGLTGRDPEWQPGWQPQQR